MNAALALFKAPPARTAAAFAQLIEDPNPRIRLIAARSLLSQDPADARGVAVVTAALTDSAIKVRRAALDLIESLDPGAATWRDALKERSTTRRRSEIAGNGRPAGRAPGAGGRFRRAPDDSSGLLTRLPAAGV